LEINIDKANFVFMKKNLVLLIISIYSYLTGTCQNDALQSFEQQRISTIKKGLLILGGWSVSNIIAGAVGSHSSNKEVHYFNQMNVIWGGTNLLIAGLGYLGANKENTNGATLSKVLLHQNKVEKTFLFNAGLDVAYVAAGFYLAERSKQQTDPAKLKGYGNSVKMQGGFLLLFDAIMYKVHQQHGKKLINFTDKISIVASPTAFVLTYRL
jgi:hypothetical protein